MNEYRYEDLSEGMSESFSVTVTQDMMDAFLKLTGDVNPLHNDLAFAKENGHPNRVVYGMLTASFLSTLAGVYLPGKYSLIHTVETEFVRPVYPGDTLTVKGTVREMDDRFRTFHLKFTMTNQNGIKVCRGKMRIGVSV